MALWATHVLALVLGRPPIMGMKGVNRRKTCAVILGGRGSCYETQEVAVSRLAGELFLGGTAPGSYFLPFQCPSSL